MFSVGAKYEWVTLAFLIGFLVPLPTYIMYKITGKKAWGYLNPSIILWFMGNLFVGINSSLTTFFLVAYFAQFYLRKYHPEFFVKYNYLVSAAMDGGTQVMVFILTFAVAGGSGVAHRKFYQLSDASKNTLTHSQQCQLGQVHRTRLCTTMTTVSGANIK